MNEAGFRRNNLVPVVGLEPTTLAGRDFESRAYANSATPAFKIY